MKKLLLLVLTLFSLGVANAQFVPVDGNKARVQASFNSVRTYVNGIDTILVANVKDTTNTLNGGGYMIMADNDTSLFYHKDDTARLFTTASSWLFTPSLPCCTPDTIPLNFITTQCTTVTANKWRPVLTDSLGRASTTACDTISYLYVDSISFNYGNGNLKGTPNQVAYFNNSGNLISSDSLTFGGEQFSVKKSISQIQSEFTIDLGNGFVSYNNLDTFFKTNAAFSYLPTLGTNGKGLFSVVVADDVDSLSTYIRQQTNLYEINAYQSLSENNLKLIGVDTTGFYIGNKSSVNSTTYLNKTYFPTDTPSIGQSLTAISNDGNGNAVLSWGNQTLSGSATLDFGSIGAHAYEDLTITVTGATVGDVVSLGLPNGSVPADASFFAWVSATDTVTVRCFNIDGGTVDPASGTFKVKIFK